MVTLRPSSTADAVEDRLASLSAPTADPLWMLARQWQTSGFQAEDGGSPVTVTLSTTVAPVSFSGTVLDGDLAPLVEAEPLPAAGQLDTRERVRLASELVRRLGDTGLAQALVTGLRTAWADAYPFAAAEPGSPFVTSAAARLPDPVALLDVLRPSVDGAGTTPFPELPGLPGDPVPAGKVEAAVRSWFGWAAGQLSDGKAGSVPAAWNPQRLAYAAILRADTSSGPVSLTSDDYDGNGFEWYNFDRTTLPTAPDATGDIVTVQPAPVTYPGMPQPGYWSMEDGDVRLDPSIHTDPAQQLLASFAHSYANDWFLIPLTVAPGVCLIAGLEVTDTFGTTTTVPSAAKMDGPGSPWQLWELDATGQDAAPAADGALGLRLFLPHHAPPLEGPEQEDVLLTRDELANLAWLVELTTRDADGSTVDRYRRWLQRRPPTDPTFNPGAVGDARSYRLGTTIPDYWYALMPGGPVGALVLAALLDGATDVSDDGVQGTLVPHPTAVVADRTVARTGTRVTRVARLNHDRTGRAAWTARTSRFGTGESSSGLRFDLLGGSASPTSLPQSPDLGPAQRTPPKPLVGKGHGGGSALRDWWLWNNTDSTTTTWVEPTSRPGGSGWMLHVETNGAGCGVVQQWAPNGTGPSQATTSVDVYVLSGEVHVGAGDGGNIGVDGVSTTTHAWERIVAATTRSPVNEVIVYSHDGPAEFLLDRIDVTAAREPG